jgi:hypothetical protein
MILLLRMALIALLAGFVIGGAAWYVWGAIDHIRQQRAQRKRLAADADALLATANKGDRGDAL